MASGDKVYIADKTTLDSVNTKVGSSSDSASSSGTTLFALLKDAVSNVSSLATYWTSARATKIDGIGSSSDTASSSGTTLFALLKQAVTDSARLTSTRAGYIDRIANSTYGLDKIKTVVDTASSNASSANTAIGTANTSIGATGDTGGSSTAGTVMGKLNKVISTLGTGQPIAKYGTTTTLATLSAVTSTAGSLTVKSGTFVAPYDGEYRLDIKVKTSAKTGSLSIWIVPVYGSTLDRNYSTGRSISSVSISAVETDTSKTFGVYLMAGESCKVEVGVSSGTVSGTITVSGTVKYVKA